MRRLASLALAAGMAAMTTGEAFAVDWLFPTSNRESRFCDDSGILARVQRGFRYGVLHVPNLPNVSIVAFHGIHENRYQPFGDEQPIARRYCGAKAEMSDGRMHDVWYLIEDRMGFAGVGDEVEWCVSGFDRWKVYNGNCRVLR